MDDTKTNNLPIKWLKFLINWRIPIGLLLNALSLNTLVNNMPPKDLFSIAFESFYFLIAIILPILTLVYCVKFKKVGYYLLKSSLIIEVVFNSAISSINTISPYTENPLSSVLIAFISVVVISSLAWIYPNFVYLKKRKYLFVSKKKNLNSETPKKDDNTNEIINNDKKNTEKSKKVQTQEKSIKNNTKKEEFTFSISKNKLIIMICFFILVILISIGIYNYINSLKSEINSLQKKYNKLNTIFNLYTEDISWEEFKKLKKLEGAIYE